MRQSTVGYLAAIATLAVVTTAEAASIPIPSVTPTVLFADFNVIVQNDLTSNTDIQGPVMVGCPATGCVSTQGLTSTGGPINSMGVVLGSPSFPSTTGINGYGEVNVFGNVLTAVNQHVSVNGSVTLVGGAYPSGAYTGTGAGSMLGVYAFPTGTTVANNPATFQQFIWSPLTSLSTSLGMLTHNSTFSGNTFTGLNGPNGAVFSVNLSALQSAGSLTLAGCLASTNPGGPCDAVINVMGAGTLNNASLAFPLVAGFPNILVNFENDVALTTSNVWTASILDPLGSVIGKHQIDGDVVAMNFTTSDETHFVPFDCSDNLCAPMSFPPLLPEPGSLALLGSAFAAFAAFAGLAAIRRRRA